MAKIDKRTAADILNSFKERAESYTPEWNMNTDNPDIAAALAITFARMAAGTIKRLNGVPLKNKIAFFNAANALLLPSEPSKGFVSFSLAASDSADTYLPAGTALAASAGDDVIRFETLDGITVSNARIEKIFCTDDSSDFIGEYENFREKGFTLFQKPLVNLQSHSMTVEHPYIFDLGCAAEIRLMFFRKGGAPVSDSAVRAFADSDSIKIKYYAGEESGYAAFERVEFADNGLTLFKSGKSPRFAPNANGSFEIKFTVNDISFFDKFSFVRMTAASSGRELECDFASDGDTEYPKTEFFPFGERFRLFGEAYFACREALSKRGSRVTVSFNLKFVKVPLENQQPNPETEWKWIVKKGDLKQPVEYNISILEVVWEYYNGKGWCRLFPDSSYGDVFDAALNGGAERRQSVTFVCPEDIAPVFVGSEENFFIRARITKAENLYKTLGSYLSPYLSSLSFEYVYPDGGHEVKNIAARNNIAEFKFDPLEAGCGFVPFRRTESAGRAIYLGFSAPPENSPYRIMWEVAENPLASPHRLMWDYLSEKGFRCFNIIDETAGFTKTGLTVFMDNRGFKKEKLFGHELYWVRITDHEEYGNFYYPTIKRIFENSVKAENKDGHMEELVAMNVYGENIEYELSEKNILEFELYVNETASISEAEEKILEKENRIIRQDDDSGLSEEIWVKWREVEAFAGETENSRCYTLDRGLGKFRFGNGRHGKIPPASDVNNIHAIYAVGGGSRSNVGEGQINRIERSAGFVTGVFNPRKFVGGCDTETLEDAMRRCSVTIRTQDRAVTAEDFERLVPNASRSIGSVRCFTGYNSAGKKEGGAVTLVIVKNNDADFCEIQADILNYLRPRMSCAVLAAGKLYITEPEYIEVNVRAKISVKSFDNIFLIKTNIEKRLASFLGCGESGKNMWEIGQIPNEQQIRGCIIGAEKAVRIDSIYITLRAASSKGSAEIDAEEVAKRSFILPKNGTHDIMITTL